MKLPKRIAELLKRKQDYIDSQRSKLEASVLRLQSDLFSNVIAEIIPELDVKDGLIQDTAKNYKLISVLDKTYKDFQKGVIVKVLPQVLTTTKTISSLSRKYYNVLMSSNIPERFEKIIADSNKLINLKIGLEGDKVFKGGWLDSFFNSNKVGM